MHASKLRGRQDLIGSVHTNVVNHQRGVVEQAGRDYEQHLAGWLQTVGQPSVGSSHPGDTVLLPRVSSREF
jgi:hypothetical protein